MKLLVDKSKIDHYIVGISGGKDSTALALWLWFESGIPREKLIFTFCDTHNEDAFTYGFIWLLAKIIPITVLQPEHGFLDLAIKKSRFPSSRVRFCTQMLKVFPSRDFAQSLIKQGKTIVQVTGVRHAEGVASNDRGTAKRWEFDLGTLSWVWRPILKFTMSQVWQLHNRYINLSDIIEMIENDPNLTPENKTIILTSLHAQGIACNPLYYMGASRVGCYPCFMSNKPELFYMGKFRPERFPVLAEWETKPIRNGNNQLSPFFPPNKTPKRFRSHIVTTKNGREVPLATAMDVKEWSKTARGGKQFMMELEELPPTIACDIGGHCE